MKLTPYVSVKTPPTIPGVYLTKREKSTCPFWRAFDGKNWRYGLPAREVASPSYEDARRLGKISSYITNFNWCGLTENPE